MTAVPPPGRRRRRGLWRRVLEPVGGILAAVFARIHLWVIVMVLLYLGSGVTIVGPHEVGIVRRFGRIVGEGSASAIHGPGLVFALPPPIDDVVRVNVKRVYETDLGTLAPPAGEVSLPTARTIDPVRVGYALTGDHNIVHARFEVHYRVADPIAFLLGPSEPERVLIDVVTSEAVRAVGGRGVDDILTEGRSELVDAVRARAQAGLDAAGLGIAIVSLELTALGPPTAVAAAFTAVQSAVIAAQTKKDDAQTARASALPAAESNAAESRSAATKYAVDTRATAEADATAFKALAAEYRRSPTVVRERLYRDALARIIPVAAKREILPPPVGGRYSGLRITLPSENVP